MTVRQAQWYKQELNHWVKRAKEVQYSSWKANAEEFFKRNIELRGLETTIMLAKDINRRAQYKFLHWETYTSRKE